MDLKEEEEENLRDFERVKQYLDESSIRAVMHEMVAPLIKNQVSNNVEV